MSKFIALKVAFCLLLVGCLNDTLDASYDSLADVDMTKGWVPAWLPETAVNLREVHNLDSNASALAFDIPPGGAWQLPEHCRSVTFADTAPSHFDRSWWPSESSLSSSYSLYQCKADASPDFAFVGISKTGRRGVHWRAYAR
ncbi:hypothetical protein QFW80_00070 [Luteimonas sp. M1R5S18]|uniref:YbbD head domain-containing protein n=1 Tax=Luteimonas rhizosphaericola TaxID=3042024 RepID=A0ABT6JE24_9GAMM|nr:hypothetical protein [Luteimonas rhizosphaericola]MDH5828919.1 hypothetical protein [Luteimonas rhizosphaericola]